MLTTSSWRLLPEAEHHCATQILLLQLIYKKARVRAGQKNLKHPVYLSTSLDSAASIMRLASSSSRNPSFINSFVPFSTAFT